ncbi:RE1 [Symbiodinium natans]|uniref:RE1 protein n=1 Tax=Symbiodinium natans TaxID=878477 RepID=A0A812QL26_9DINO|nr:RE1 [Symbiodinium natans]
MALQSSDDLHNLRPPTGQVMSPMMPMAEGMAGVRDSVPGQAGLPSGEMGRHGGYGTLNPIPNRSGAMGPSPLMNGVNPAGVAASLDGPTITGSGEARTALGATNEVVLKNSHNSLWRHHLLEKPPGSLKNQMINPCWLWFLVKAYYNRPKRMLQGTGVEQSDQDPVHSSEDHVVWYSRLRGLVQGVVNPVMERVQVTRSRTAMSSPQAWQSPTTTPEPREAGTPLMEPAMQQAMQEWTQRTSLLQPRQDLFGSPAEHSSGESVSPEMVQEEVRRQVQIAIQGRDVKVHQLQSENDELKKLLHQVMEAASRPQGVGEEMTRADLRGRLGSGGLELPGVRRARGSDRPHQPEELRPIGVENGAAGLLGPPPGLDGGGYRASFVNNDSGNVGGGAQGQGTGKPPTGLSSDLQGGQAVASEGENLGKNDTLPEAGRSSGGAGSVGGGGPKDKETSTLELLAHGIQQLQQMQMKKDGHDPEILKGSVELPKMPEPYTDSSSVAFLEWMYEAGQLIGSLTEKASGWWEANSQLAVNTYKAYQGESPLQKLKIRAGANSFVDDEKWSRLERRVMALLLQSMQPQIKNEVMMLRIDKVKDCLFKLYTIYTPGGASERASLIKQLEYIAPQDSPTELTASLRKWKKLVSRASEMGVNIPDGSVLLVAVENAIKKVVSGQPDMAFKLNMAKQDLQLPYQPHITSVLTYVDHILAELQQVIPIARNDPKLKGMNVEPKTPSNAGSPARGQKAPCKFWSSDEGCRKGSSCKFAHEFLSKEEKKGRCWHCGGKNHRQNECPVKTGKSKGGGKGSSSTQSTTPPTSTTATVAAMAVFGNIDLVRFVLGCIYRLVFGATVETNEAIATLNHFLRSQDEVQKARKVAVQLADGRQLGAVTWVYFEVEPEARTTIHHPEHGLLPTKLVGNCPVLREAEALKLISDLEEVELGKLKANNMDGVMRALNTGGQEEGPSWKEGLDEFVATGSRKALRRMLLDPDSPVGSCTEDEIVAMIGLDDVNLSDSSGASILKGLPLNRAARRRLLSTRWAIHMFSGESKEAEMETESMSTLKIDLRISKRYDMLKSHETTKALLWAAARGQVEGLYGGPPRKMENQELLTKKFWLMWIIANRGAELSDLRKPFVAMELPGPSDFWNGPVWQGIKSTYDVATLYMEVNHERYAFATNLNVPNGFLVPNFEALSQSTPPRSQWPDELKQRLYTGMKLWRVYGDEGMRLRMMARMTRPVNMTEKELKHWEDHVKAGHIPYDRRCQTCVRTAATGRAHRRTLAPSAYSLSLDIAGPFRARGETADSARYRYLLVGAYCHPKLEEEAEVQDDGLGVDNDDPMEEEDKGDPVEEEDDDYQKEMNERYKMIYKHIGDDIEYQTLHFAVPMETRTGKEVFAKVRDIYLELRRDGLPLTRIHSDRGRELKGQALRSWMSERDILATTGESQQPQQNGRAEALVRQLKSRCRTLLRSSGLPRTCWPLAATFSARRQRDLALGKLDDKDLTFGAKTYVKAKVCGTGGSYDLDERWKEGVFVGYSSDVQRGKVVRFGDGGYVTSVHLRPYLVDSDDLVDPNPLELHLPAPERRVRGKARIAGMTLPETPAELLAKEYLQEEKFDLEDILRLWQELKPQPKEGLRTSRREKRKEEPAIWKTGQFTHGGICGLLEATRTMPWTTSYLTKVLSEWVGHNEFTALQITDNVGMQMHRDSHNYQSRMNVVLPVCLPEQGGGIWVEADEVNYCWEDEWRQVREAEWRRGKVHELRLGEPITFDPRKYHVTEDWVGRRVVVAMYTPRAKNMDGFTKETLDDLGFGMPEEDRRQFPDYKKGAILKMMNMAQEDKEVDAVVFQMREPAESKVSLEESLDELHELQEGIVERLRARAENLRDLLNEEEILAEELQATNEMVKEEADHARVTIEEWLKDAEEKMGNVRKVTESFFLKVANLNENDEIANVEEYLQNLQEDLKVTLDVPLDQVKLCLEKWVEAIQKELTNLEVNTGALERITMEEAKQMEREGRLRLIPGKMVFTVKPVGEANSGSISSTSPKWKRKARMVICGNRVDFDDDHTKALLYASGASAESLRIALCIAVAGGWLAAVTDITGAFLLSEWPEGKPRYGVLPPRILQQGGFLGSTDVLLVKRPLYGLRESPALWASYRTRVLKGLEIPYHKGSLRLKQLRTDSELWMIMFCEGEEMTLYGILVTYVDDLLYLSDSEIIEAVHGWIKERWPCAPLEYAKQEGGIRYLGMELVQDENGLFSLGQAGYVRNLVRIHGLSEEATSNLPCPKEWLCDDDYDLQEENYTESELRRGQKITGECLWLSCRTRPDLLFVTNYMSSTVSRSPCRVHRIGLKVIAYLNATVDLKIRVDKIPSSSNQIPSSSNQIPSSSNQIPSSSNQIPSSSNQIPSSSDQIPSSPSQTLNSSDDKQAHQVVSGHKVRFNVQLCGYSDASFAPFGGKSFGASVAVVGRTPVAWKASKQSMVSMSVCEAEMMESATCGLLLESVASILVEICGPIVCPELRVDNAAATSLLSGSHGSWRTRHLRIRHAYILDKIARGELRVKHTPGDRQLADLPTKLHPRARLMELLRLWAMFGLPELDRAHQMEDLRLCYLMLAMMAMMSIGVEGRKVEDPNSFLKEPLAATGTMELLLLLGMSCVVAVACWEMIKMIGKWGWNKMFGTKKTRKLRRLRDLAKMAAEAEVKRSLEQASEESEATIHQAMRQTGNRATSSSEPKMKTVGTQTPAVEPEIHERVVTVHVPEVRERVVHVEVPTRETHRYDRINEIYMTGHGGGAFHTCQDCQGFRLATSRVHSIALCTWCSRSRPIFTRSLV